MASESWLNRLAYSEQFSLFRGDWLAEHHAHGLALDRMIALCLPFWWSSGRCRRREQVRFSFKFELRIVSYNLIKQASNGHVGDRA